MNNPKVEVDIVDILNKIDSKIENSFNKLDSKIDRLSEEIKNDQKKLLEEVNNLKVGQERLSGKIDTLDTKVEQLDKRVSNQEFNNRGILIGLVVVILGGAAKLFGFMPNP